MYISLCITYLAVFTRPVPSNIVDQLASKNRPLVARHAGVSDEVAGEMIAADKNLGFKKYTLINNQHRITQIDLWERWVLFLFIYLFILKKKIYF